MTGGTGEIGVLRFDGQRREEYGIYKRRLGATNRRQMALMKSELRRCLKEKLTPRQRQVIIMYYYENMTMETIAHELGVNVSTVCRTIHRGRGRIERHIREIAEM
jgi:RNA polymerase sigma factor (sigma-70 family)